MLKQLNEEEKEEVTNINNNLCEPLTYAIDSQMQNDANIPQMENNIINDNNICSNINIENENEVNENFDNYDSDIDDPKYRPSPNILLNQNNNLFLNNDANDDCFQNKYKTLQNNRTNLNNSINKSKVHNYDNIELNQENLSINKSKLELENENELLKQELFKKTEALKNKDEIISEFQNLFTDFKTKFEQYESRNNQLKQQVNYLEQQLASKNNEINISSSKKQITDIDPGKNIFLYKQQINDLEAEFNSKNKKLVEKYKEKENNLKKEKDEEISKISKNLNQANIENDKLK